jgi:CheY-like chemotaxis protein
MSAPIDLGGRRILVIEDESLVSMFIIDTLEDIGGEIVATADNLAAALEKAASTPYDLAIRDLNLGGEPTFAVADMLADRGTPFVIATGYGTSGLPERLRGTPALSKPFHRRDLERAMRAALTR